jgi:hypothetical protein
VLCLPVRTSLFFNSNPQATVTADPSGLVSFGALTNIEVHVPTPVAQGGGQPAPPLPAPQTGMALIDTGATFTSVHEPLLIALGLTPINVITAGTANGPVQQNVYAARLNFPGLGWDVGLVQITASNLSGQVTPASHGVPSRPLIALIGRDLLAQCSFHWEGTSGFWSISW